MSTLPDINTLSGLPSADHEVLWLTHLGGAVPEHLPKFLLARLLAYRIQVQQQGGLSKVATRFLDQIANDLDAYAPRFW